MPASKLELRIKLLLPSYPGKTPGLCIDWKRANLLKTQHLRLLCYLDSVSVNRIATFASRAEFRRRSGWRSNASDPLGKLVGLGLVQLLTDDLVTDAGPRIFAENGKAWGRLFDEYWWPMWLERTGRSDKKAYSKKCWMKLMPKTKDAIKPTISRIARLTMQRTEEMLDKGREYRPHASTFLNREDWSDSAEKEIDELL